MVMQEVVLMKTNILKKILPAVFLVLFSGMSAFAQNSNFTKGEEYFRKNEPA
jgi:hypothetical protein